MENATLNLVDSPSAQRTQTVLLGDDDEGVRQLLSEVLNAEGFVVIQAENRRRAVEIYQEQNGHIDLVLLDMSRARPSAEDALTSLRTTNATAKVLLLTGNSNLAAVRETAGKGFNGFVSKPFTVSELLAPLRQLVGMDEVAAAAI